MGLWGTIVQKLAGATIQQQVDVRVRESLQLAGFLQEDWGWTRISEGRSNRDLQPLHHEQMIALALYAYDRNPLGKWTLEMTRDLICAEGITVTADDDAVSEVLQQFWDFPINNLDLNLPQMILELGLFGEQCWPVFASESGGTMALGLVDPADIKAVIHDPDNCAIPIGVTLKDRGAGEGPKFKIIYDRPDEELFAAKARQMREEEFVDGETFWWRLNGVRSATRGRSDLFALLDWLDGYEKFLLYTLDRTALLNAFTWDVTLEGMTNEEVAAWLKANPRPDPGAWFAHNERVKLAAITPNLGGADAADHGRMIRNHVLGASGFPEHWFGGGGDVNRACYDEQTEVLTSEGFRSYVDIGKDTLIAMYDPDLDELQWTPAGPCYLYDYDGPMVHFLNKNVDMMVTPDHRMYAKRGRNRREAEAYEIIEAKDMVANTWNVLTAAPFAEQDDLETFTLPAVPTGTSRAIYPEVEMDGDTWATFLGYWLSEGHARVHKGRYIVNLVQKDPLVTEKIRACLSRMPEIRWRESLDEGDGCTRWVVADKALCLWLMEHGGIKARGKRFPALVQSFSRRQQRLLFDALIDGDGSRPLHDGHAGLAYYTASPQLADDVQCLALNLGYRAKVTDLRKQTSVLRLQMVAQRRETVLGMQAIRHVPYQGKVFCYRVPSGLFVTRRNGKVAIQGNTAAEMSAPTFKRYLQRQRLVKYVVERLCHHQLMLAREAGTLRTDELQFSVNMPQMVTQDLTGIFSALTQLSSAAQVAEDRGWIDAGTSARLFAALASRSGVDVEVDPEQVNEEAQVTPEYRRNGHVPQGDETVEAAAR